MNPLKIMVINDDGPDTPLLIPLLDSVAAQPWCGELRVVVPESERSWTGHAYTRFEPVQVNAATFGSHKGYTLSGTPADCASIGIHNLYDSAPDLVLSGVNFGANFGRGFFVSSGTVGGASAASLCKVRSIALSMHVPTEVWRARRSEEPEAMAPYKMHWINVANASSRICAQLLNDDLWSHSDFFSVNFPWETTANTEFVLSRLRNVHFKATFEQNKDGHFTHSFQGLDHEQHFSENHRELPDDITVLEQGKISVSAINYGFCVESGPGCDALRELFNGN